MTRIKAPTPARQLSPQSDGERAMETHLRMVGLWPRFVTEYRFDPRRQWRFDFAALEERVAIEVEGGTWVKGAHSRGKGFEEDCEKYAEAAIAGWAVLRVTTHMVEDGRAIALVQRLMATRR